MIFRILFFIIGLSFSKGFSNPLYFKFPFKNVTELKCRTYTLEENSTSEIIYNFTYTNEVWRETAYIINNNQKKLNYFINFQNENFNFYNHKRANIQNGILIEKENKKSTIKISNPENDQIGFVTYTFNSKGYTLSASLTYFNHTIDKEIKNISVAYQYNCKNELIYVSHFYSYFEHSHKYKRRKNTSYKITYCNPDKHQNYKDVYYYDEKYNSLIKHEKRTFKYQ